MAASVGPLSSYCSTFSVPVFFRRRSSLSLFCLCLYFTALGWSVGDDAQESLLLFFLRAGLHTCFFFFFFSSFLFQLAKNIISVVEYGQEGEE